MDIVTAVAPSVSRLRQVAGILEVLEAMLAAVRSGDADARCDVAEPGLGIGVDALEHLRMVQSNLPPMVVFSDTLTSRVVLL